MYVGLFIVYYIYSKSLRCNFNCMSLIIKSLRWYSYVFDVFRNVTPIHKNTIIVITISAYTHS